MVYRLETSLQWVLDVLALCKFFEPCTYLDMVSDPDALWVYYRLDAALSSSIIKCC